MANDPERKVLEYGALELINPDGHQMPSLEHTHTCFTGRTQIGCVLPCTIAADQDEREVFSECVCGVAKALGVDTVVFHRIECKRRDTP